MINLKEQFKNWRWLRSWRPYFVIFALGFLLYSQTLFFDYTYFDDNELITNKIEVLKNVKNVPLIFSTDAFLSNSKVYYRPILNLSFMVDTQFSEGLAFFYHLSNVLLHIFAVMLIFYFLQKINYSKGLSFFLSLIFLAHPVLTQAVAWLPGRNDSLVAIFVLLAFVSFLKFLENPRFKSYLIYLLFFFIALLTKETAIFLPVLIAFYFSFVDTGKILKSDKYLLLLGSGAVAFVWFIMRHLALGNEPINYIESVLGIINNTSAILISFGKALLPFNLSVMPTLADSTTFFGVIALILMLAAIFTAKRKNNRLIIFGILWFGVFLLPSFIPFNNLPYFLEHRLYLSLVGFLIVIAETDYLKNLDFSNKKTKIISALIIFVLMILTFWHSTSFRDRFSFWQGAVKNSPHSPLAQKNLGAMYYLDDKPDLALPYYLNAMALNPEEPMVHNNIGLIYYEKGDYKNAEAEFTQELRLYPNYDKALLNLGNVYLKQNKYTEADYLFEAALRANPYNFEAYQGLLNIQKRLK